MHSNTRSRRSTILGLLAAGALLGAAMPALAQSVVNVYTNREPGLYSATLDEFTKATGIKVNALFSEQGLAERIKAEGANSPADVLITVDIGRLQEAVDLGITQPIRSEGLAANIPAPYRDPDGRWFALSLRARAVYAARDRVQQEDITYEDLADPKWKGKICTRSFQHQYNLALTAAMLVKHGEAETEAWLRGVKANLAKKPSGAIVTSPRTLRPASATSDSATNITLALWPTARPSRRSGWRPSRSSCRHSGTAART